MDKSQQIITISLFFIALLSFRPSNAQDKTVKGYVTTFDSIPLVNAEVMALSSKTVVYTDSLGNFEISCLSKDKLKVSANGFVTRRTKVKPQVKYVLVNLHMESDPGSQEIAVGYGHVRDADKLNAISSSQNQGSDFSRYSNIYDLLQSQFPDLVISNGDIIIRGPNSLNGSSAALLLIDGAVVSSTAFEMISPVEVKRVSVLKDGSAAIYGSRGAGGVVSVELKKGND